MKKFMALAFLVSSVSSFAASVKVTSFNYVSTQNDIHNPLAELCGLVDGATTSPVFLSIVVDPKSRRPATYNTLADANGKFCIAVITYRGQADVSLIGTNTSASALIQ